MKNMNIRKTFCALLTCSFLLSSINFQLTSAESFKLEELKVVTQESEGVSRLPAITNNKIELAEEVKIPNSNLEFKDFKSFYRNVKPYLTGVYIADSFISGVHREKRMQKYYTFLGLQLLTEMTLQKNKLFVSKPIPKIKVNKASQMVTR